MNKKIVVIICILILTVTASATLSEAFNLPDTGQTKCYRGVYPYDEIPCTGTGQDGEYNINPMSFTDNDNGTVTDNNTELMWQKCSAGQNNDTTCSGTAVTYNWYQASGTYNTTYNPSSQDVCGELTTGGYTDWRLPTKKELITIVDYGIPYPGPTINTTYFLNTKASSYWSSTTYASVPVYAWFVYFYGGSVVYDGKNYNFYVRCVRGGQSAESFVNNGDGTVTDNKTGLMWQQEEPGQMTWDSALSYCEGLTLGGNSDWRLPNIKEIESLTDDTRYNPAIDTAFFPGAYASYYWSSTTHAYYPFNAWRVYFYYSYINFSDKDFCCFPYVRCVRGGQSGSFDVKISGGAYNFPQTTAYKASFSMDITKISSLTGWLKYYYARTRMNFVSTSITGVSVSGNTATISGTGKVNNINGYKFTATITDNAPDSFGITINKPDGSLYYSAPPKSVSGGDLKIELL